MRLGQRTVPVGVPFANGIFQTATGKRIEAVQPLAIAADLPVAVEFHDPAQLTIRSRVKMMVGRTIGEAGAEVDVSRFVHGTLQLLFPQGLLQGREKVRQRLGIIPNVGAGAGTRAALDAAALPGPDVPVFLAQNRRGFEDSEVRRDRVEHGFRHRGGKQGVLKGDGFFPQILVMPGNVTGNPTRVTPLAGIVRSPQRGIFPRNVTGRNLIRPTIGLHGRIGEMPGDHDRDRRLLSRCQFSLDQERAAVAPVPPGGGLPVVRGELSRLHLPPEGGDPVEPTATQPHGLDLRTLADHRQTGAAERVRPARIGVGEQDALTRNYPVTGSLMSACSQHEMREMVGKLEIDLARGFILQTVFQDRARQARSDVVERYERTPADKLDGERDLRIGELDAAKRIAAGKTHGLKPGQSLVAAPAGIHGRRPYALVVDFSRRKRPFHQSGERSLAPDPQEGKSRLGLVPSPGRCGGDAGTVLNREILETAMTVQTDAPGSQPTEGQGGLQKFPVLERKKRGGRGHG